MACSSEKDETFEANVDVPLLEHSGRPLKNMTRSEMTHLLVHLLNAIFCRRPEAISKTY